MSDAVARRPSPTAPSTSGPTGLTLRRRLALLLGISAVVLIVAGAVLFSSLATLGTERERVIRDLDPGVIATRDLRAALVDQETGVRGYVLTGASEFREPYDRGLAAAAAADGALSGLAEGDPVLAAEIDEARRAAEVWQSEFARPALALAADGDAQAARDDDLLNEGRARFDEVRASVDRLEASVNSRRDVAVAELDRAASRVWSVTVGALFGIVAVGIVIAVALKRSVTDPIIELAEEVRAIADGDLARTVSVEGTPELERLGSDIDAMRLQILGEVERLNAANRAIEQQARDLERSNADLEQFAYVASHDLQEPLRKIAGFCQLLERRYKGQLDDRADEYIAFVVDGAQRMQDLINDLLAFSRVGRTTDRFEVLDLTRVAQDAIANLRTAIDETQARIDLEPLPTVLGDRRLLIALFQNLIGNAVKFHGDEPPIVRVSAEPADATTDGGDHGGGERWIVSVADNGIGIDGEYAEQIFTIFQRLHARTDYEGTGIGLALAKKIAEHHDGTIWLDTTVDRGATFRVAFPTVDPDAAAPTPEATDDASPDADPPSPRPAQEANRS